MAVPVIESTTTTVVGTSTTTFQFDMPATRPDDDLYLLVATKDDTQTINLEGTYSDWNVIEDYGTSENRVKAWQLIGSSEPASYSVSSAMDSETYVAYVIRISGIDTTTPVNVSVATTGYGKDPHTSPTVTTTTDDCLIIRFMGSDDASPYGDTYTSTPTTELVKNSSSEDGGSGATYAAVSYESKASLGATGTANFVSSNTNRYHAITIGIAPSAGGTAYTLVCAGGTFTQTGTAATLKRGLKIAAVTDQYDFVGTAASLERGLLVSAETVAYSLVGSDATLTYAGLTHYSLSCEAGAYVLSGTAATLKADRVVDIGSGAYVQNGTAASLEKGYKLQADSAAFVHSGTASNLLRGYKSSAANGAYVLTGTAATFDRTYIIVPVAGAYVHSGTAATLDYSGTGSKTLVVESGTFTQTGTAASLKYGRLLTASSDVYNVSGTAASLEIGRKLAAAGGSYDATFTAANLLRGYRAAASNGSYLLSGTAVTFPYNRVLTSGIGAYILTGAAIADINTLREFLLLSTPITRSKAETTTITRSKAETTTITREKVLSNKILQ